MKYVVKDLKYGEIVYEESFFTGKRKIVFNGFEMTKEKGRTYVAPYGEDEIKVKLKGNILFGIKLKIEDDTVVMSRNLYWYELLLTVLIPLLIFSMTKIGIPVIINTLTGFVTGLICGVAVVLNMLLTRKMSTIPLRIVVWVGIFLCAFLLSFSFTSLFL